MSQRVRDDSSTLNAQTTCCGFTSPTMSVLREGAMEMVGARVLLRYVPLIAFFMATCGQAVRASISLASLGPPLVTVAPATAVAVLLVECTAELDEPAALWLLPSPSPGVSALLVPRSVSCGGQSAIVVRVNSTVAPGQYWLGVEARTSSATRATLALQLVVLRHGPVHPVVVTVPDELVLRQGQTAEVMVIVGRPETASESLTLSAVTSASAQHVRLDFSSLEAHDVCRLSVSIGVNVPPRTYVVTVQALGGRWVANGRLTIVVTAPGEQ